MAAQKLMSTEYAWDPQYHLSSTDEVLTPALLIYPEIVAQNVAATLRLLGGDRNRWRVHIKTAKLAATLRILLDHGVSNFKCATTLELLIACESGAEDVLVAYPSMGANARRIREISQQFPSTRISVLVESQEQLSVWRGTGIGIFIDINPGMNRTGIEQSHSDEVVWLVRAIAAGGLEFRGLHYYDGQYGAATEPERTQATHAGYRQLLQLVARLEASASPVREIITAGTPTFPCSLSFAPFRQGNFLHRISPGTVVYCDATSSAQLPAEYGYQAAALVLTRVVSRPRAGVVTCDAGHKTVSADAGVPTCVVLGHPELTALSPSEEHLPFAVAPDGISPGLGESLYLLPRHICPTVNNFDIALLVRNGRIESVQRVSARGREIPVANLRSALAGRD